MNPQTIPPKPWDTEGQRGLASRPAMIDQTIRRGQALVEELAPNMNTAVPDRLWELSATAVANGPLFFEEDNVSAIGGTDRSVRQVFSANTVAESLTSLNGICEAVNAPVFSRRVGSSDRS